MSEMAAEPESPLAESASTLPGAEDVPASFAQPVLVHQALQLQHHLLKLPVVMLDRHHQNSQKASQDPRSIPHL